LYWIYEIPGEAPGANEVGVVPAKGPCSSPGGLNLTPGLFEVAIVPAEGLPVAETLSRIFRAAARTGVLPGGKRLPSVGTFYRLLDSYALPRFFLGREPPADKALFCDELLLQLALWAHKFEHLQTSDQIKNDLARLFISYAKRIIRPEGQKDPERFTAAVDEVCMRLLIEAKPGKGISAALGRADTFRSYVRRALTCAMRSSNPARPVAFSASTFPQSIAEAAAHLGVSFATVWRHYRAGGWPEWCAEAWEAIQTRHHTKTKWRAAAQRLQEKDGKTREAARKAAYRAKKAGRTPDGL
jgi:hypothetical protein